MSIITLVQIASLTSVITINFSELSLLYLYKVPYISFYTLSTSFTIAIAIALAKLSSESELIVITSFGLNPSAIIRILLPTILISSILITIISLGLVPKTKHLSNSFIEQKKTEAKFNIKAAKFGQKFGEWLIYIEEESQERYLDVKLYKSDKKYDKFILADSAFLHNDSGKLSLILLDGKSFTFDKISRSLEQIDFKKMYINDSLNGGRTQSFTNAYEHWLPQYQTSTKFSFYILISIMPLVTIFFLISFGYYNPRYEKNRATVNAIILVTAYFVVATKLSKFYLASLYLVPLIFIIAGYIFYYYKVKRMF